MMPTDDEHWAEAERLRQLPRADQQAAIAWHRAIAADAKLRKADRDLARERADALERLLFGRKKKARKP
jgi:hypothetical protein